MEFTEEDNNRQMLEQKGIRLHPGQPTKLSRKVKTAKVQDEEENNEKAGGKFTIAGRRNRRFNNDN